MAVFVFRPGGVQQDNVFTNWETLVDAMKTVEGRKILEFDDSLVSPCVIPRGAGRERRLADERRQLGRASVRGRVGPARKCIFSRAPGSRTSA